MQLVRFRIDLSAQCSIGPLKIQLLEAIAELGSLRQAAIGLHVSYRTAWLIVRDFNQAFDESVVRASVGGTGGGGMVLTEFGADLVRRYQNAARRVEQLVQSEFADVLPRARQDAVRRKSKGKAVVRERLRLP